MSNYFPETTDFYGLHRNLPRALRGVRLLGARPGPRQALRKNTGSLGGRMRCVQRAVTQLLRAVLVQRKTCTPARPAPGMRIVTRAGFSAMLFGAMPTGTEIEAAPAGAGVDAAASGGTLHVFHAVAFVENFTLKDLASLYPSAKRSAHQLALSRPDGGQIFLYPFGAVVFHDVPAAGRQRELERLGSVQPRLTSIGVIDEEFTVREDAASFPKVAEGVLTLDRMTAQRAGVIAITVGQSAAMEYYERIVDEMFVKTDRLVERLEQRGTVPFRTRPLHRFIGAAVGTRNEVLSVLHLLDKPDEVWDDPGINRIYEGLRSEFDLSDRYQALEHKLRSIQEGLELVLDVARDRRLVLLELTIVILIVFELVLALVQSAN